MKLPFFPTPSAPVRVRQGFSSSKCAPLPYPRRSCRDFLVFATLDPATKSIRPAPIDHRHAPPDCYFAVQLSRTDGELVALLCDHTEGYHPLPDPTPGHAIPRHALNSPTIETARMVWSRRKRDVDPAFSILIQNRLALTGALTLGETLELEGAAPGDAAEWTMALACHGILDIHIDGHLRPETRITLRGGTD